MGVLGMFLAAGDGIGVFFVIFIVAAVIGVIAWGAHHQKKIRENWNLFAQQHGLSIQGSPSRPIIQGWMGKVYVTLNTDVRGSGKNRTTYTQFHASVNVPMPAGLTMYREGFFSGVGKMLGGQDVQVGDTAFDSAFIIKGSDVNGIQTLLRNPHVKKALLYAVTRQPGLRVNERALLVEHTGMTGDLAKISGAFADLCYVVQTLDAAYEELVGANGPAPARTKSVPKQVPIASRAAAAEILGAAFFKDPQVRVAGPQEDPAQRKQALSEVADVMNLHGQNLASGQSQPDVLSNFARADSMDGKVNDVFKATDPSDVFATSDSSGQSALEHYNPAHAWDSKPQEGDKGQSGFSAFDAPVSSDAFADPKPYEAPEQVEAGEMANSFDALAAMLGDGTLMSSDRDDIIERHEKTTWSVELTVDRIDSTWGFDLAEALKDGKTVEGHAGDRKLAVRFPKSRNDEIGNLRNGATVNARGKLSAWDDLFKKATLDAL